MLVQEAEGSDRAGHKDGDPAEQDVTAATTQAGVERTEQEPRRSENHHLAPSIHRGLRRIGSGERRVEAGGQPRQIRLWTDIELADVDTGQPLLGPEGFAVDDDAPRVEILDGEIGEQRDASPERY